DFASIANGGYVISTLTSATYRPTPALSSISSFVELLRFMGIVSRGQSPDVALQAGAELHECWPFPGSEGFIGIQLEYGIYVESAAVDHVSMDFALNRSSSPRHMRLWGIIADDAPGRHLVTQSADYTLSTTQLTFRGSQQVSDIILLADFEYAANIRQSLQTFSVLEPIQSLNMTFSQVVVEILSNWGSLESTCLYNVRIHGRRQ
ncbi:hypothetical protein SCHPADRAFT_803837, partial [Schizopora paradoxa]